MKKKHLSKLILTYFFMSAISIVFPTIYIYKDGQEIPCQGTIRECIEKASDEPIVSVTLEKA